MATYDFDMIIIGGGVGGLVTASGLAQLGAEVCLVEKEEGKLGGDCLYYGCVPSKTLIRSARLAHRMRTADRYGLPEQDPDIEFSKVMDRMWSVIEKLEEHDDPRRFRDMGVDVRFGEGRFTGPHAFELDEETLTGRRFTVATGSSAALPPIDGLENVEYLTNVGALRLEELPGSMIVVGGGPIGLELGQTFGRFGSDVHVVEALPRILPKEDEEVSLRVRDLLESDGLTISTDVRVRSVREEDGDILARIGGESGEETLRAEKILVATGRRPNLAGLNLEAAGVRYDERNGIDVDRTMRTSRDHVFAVGDVTGTYPFTHVAEYQAGIVVGNVMTAPIPFYHRRANYDVVPWCTFTDPEVARVGRTESEAREEYGEDHLRVDRFSFEDQDRAVIEGENRGMIKLVYRKKLLGVELLGAHIVGPSAGELIHEYALAMNNGVQPAGISGTMHVYPTLSQSVKRATDLYFGDVLFRGWIPWLVKKYLRWTR